MKLSQAKEWLPFVQAAADGKTIQSNKGSFGVWYDIQSLNEFFRENEDLTRYRIKPEPKLRPWRPEEVPLNDMFQFGGAFIKVLRVESDKVWFLDSTGRPTYNNLDYGCFQSMKHSNDGGKTWLVCGITE